MNAHEISELIRAFTRLFGVVAAAAAIGVALWAIVGLVALARLIGGAP